jgi:hypothetical protein
MLCADFPEGFSPIPRLRSTGSARRNPSVAKSQPKADPPVAEMPSASKQTSSSGASTAVKARNNDVRKGNMTLKFYSWTPSLLQSSPRLPSPQSNCGIRVHSSALGACGYHDAQINLCLYRAVANAKSRLGKDRGGPDGPPRKGRAQH